MSYKSNHSGATIDSAVQQVKSGALLETAEGYTDEAVAAATALVEAIIDQKIYDSWQKYYG